MDGAADHCGIERGGKGADCRREFGIQVGGLAVEIPPGYEGQVRPRSGLAARHGIALLNAPGTIDPGYRGELKVLLINHSDEDYRIEPGERIAHPIILGGALL